MIMGEKELTMTTFQHYFEVCRHRNIRFMGNTHDVVVNECFILENKT